LQKLPETLYLENHSSCPEDEALTSIAYDQLTGMLSPDEGSYLSLRLQGCSWRAAALLLGLTPYQSKKLASSIRRKASQAFGLEPYRQMPLPVG
jgi:hypothetical protein